MAADRTSRSSARFRRDDSCCSTTSCTSHTVPTPALCRFVAKLAVASGVIAHGPLAGDLLHLLQVVPVVAAHGFHNCLQPHVAAFRMIHGPCQVCGAERPRSIADSAGQANTCYPASRLECASRTRRINSPKRVLAQANHLRV